MSSVCAFGHFTCNFWLDFQCPEKFDWNWCQLHCILFSVK